MALVKKGPFFMAFYGHKTLIIISYHFYGFFMTAYEPCYQCVKESIKKTVIKLSLILIINTCPETRFVNKERYIRSYSMPCYVQTVTDIVIIHSNNKHEHRICGQRNSMVKRSRHNVAHIISAHIYAIDNNYITMTNISLL